MKLVRLFGWVGVAALAAVGCTGGNGGIERTQLLREMISAVCENVATCCHAASLDLDNVKCRDEVSFPMSGPIGDPRLAYDAMQAEDCVAAVRDAAKGCEIIDYAPCYKAFTGNLPPGASCSLWLDCTPGVNAFATCSRDGHCVQPTRGRPNEPCSYSCVDGPERATCQSIYNQAAPIAEVACHSNNGLTCALSGSTPTCQPITGDCRQRVDYTCPGGGACDQSSGVCLAPVPVGAPCGPTAKCVASAYCGSGVCQPLKRLNALCVESVECASLRCDGGLCVPFSRVASLLCTEH